MGLHKQFINNVIFPTWACAAGFNNNNNVTGLLATVPPVIDVTGLVANERRVADVMA